MNRICIELSFKGYTCSISQTKNLVDDYAYADATASRVSARAARQIKRDKKKLKKMYYTKHKKNYSYYSCFSSSST